MICLSCEIFTFYFLNRTHSNHAHWQKGCRRAKISLPQPAKHTYRPCASDPTVTPDVQVSVRGPPDSSERTSLLLKRLHRDIWQKNARFDIEYGVYYLDPVEQETLWSLCMNVSSDVIQEHELLDYYLDLPYQSSL